MSRFRQKSPRRVPGLNTAALPDLIFTVLFFFMIVTQMRQVELKVRYQVPQGTEVEKVKRKSSVVHIYIGHLQSGSTNQADKDFHIQVNNRLVNVSEVGACISAERERLSPDDQQRMTVSIKADRDVPMGIINDVKQELRKAGALRVNYSATKKSAE